MEKKIIKIVKQYNAQVEDFKLWAKFHVWFLSGEKEWENGNFYLFYATPSGNFLSVRGSFGVIEEISQDYGQ
jgi:hypothetical protein